MSATAQKPMPKSVDNATDTDLPEGWAKAEVSEFLTLLNGYPFKPSHWKGRGRPIIRIQNLNNPDALFNYCPDDIPHKYIVRKGDLLFAWSGTPGTSFGAHIWEGREAWLNQHIFRVEFTEAFLDKRFLRLAINHNLLQHLPREGVNFNLPCGLESRPGETEVHTPHTAE
jgi:type I restriction enzyme S subunit